MIHEMLHAEMYRKLLSVAKQPNIPWTEELINSLRNVSYGGLADYYTRFWLELPPNQPPTDPQHQLMAEHFRSTIEEALREYDNSLTDLQYEAIAWAGLKGDGGNIDPTTGLPPNPTVAWQNVPLAQRLQLNSTYNDYNNSNPNCQ